MNDRRHRRAFTLTELLVVIVIITVLATMVLFALYGALENAKRARTQAQVMRLNDIIMAKWETYKTRAVRLNIPQAARADAMEVAAARLIAIRDLQRMELPDRISDLSDHPVAIQRPPVTPPLRLDAPSLWRAYRRRVGYVGNSTIAPASWSGTHQSAECLYLIVSLTRDGDTSGLDFFKETEIGDTDSDGMPEILDAWGRPIKFFRWAPGFSYSPGSDGKWGTSATDDINFRGQTGSDDELVSDLQIPDSSISPDPFDPLQVDDNIRAVLMLPPRRTFTLVPLIYSAGPDSIYDLFGGDIRYVGTPFRMDPFIVIPPASAAEAEKQIGQPFDNSGDGEVNNVDNITNHLILE